MLSWSPNAHAGINTIKIDTNKALIEAVSNLSPSIQDDKEILDFQYEKKLQEEQLINSILIDKWIQELSHEYWQENMKHIIENMIKDENTQEVIKRALKDEKVKSALEEKDKETLTKRVNEILDDFDNDAVAHLTMSLATNTVLILWIFAHLKDTKKIRILEEREEEYEWKLKQWG